MAALGDFVPPEDGDYLDEPMNPVVFGVEFTPTIIGILLALAGIGGAAFACALTANLPLLSSLVAGAQ